MHQLIQVRQQDTQAYRHRQAQVDEQIAVAGISRIQQEIQLLQQHRQQRQHILVQELEAPATYAAEQCPEQEEVVRRLLSLGCTLQRVHDQMRQVRLQHRLVFLWEDRHRHKRHLEQPQTHRSRRLVGRAERIEALHEELEQDVRKAPCHCIVRQQVLRNAQQRRRLQNLLEQEWHVRRKYLMERLGWQINKDVREQVDHVFLFAPVALCL